MNGCACPGVMLTGQRSPDMIYIRKRLPNAWRVLSSFITCLLLLSAGFAIAQEQTTGRIEHADKEPQNWLTFYGNYRGWSYSPLNQITQENVKKLVPVWAFPAGFPLKSRS